MSTDCANSLYIQVDANLNNLAGRQNIQKLVCIIIG